MNFTRSSIWLHSCQGILLSSQKALLCNPCLRNELSPFSQEGHQGCEGSCSIVLVGNAVTSVTSKFVLGVERGHPISTTQPDPGMIVNRKPCSLAIAPTRFRPRPRPEVCLTLSDR